MPYQTQLKPYRWLGLFLVYLLIACLFYKNTIHSKFIFDWNSWMVHYINEGWQGLQHCYGDRSMRWGYHLINMVLWKTFGLNEYGWFFFFLILHAANASLLVCLVEKILQDTDIKKPLLLASASGLVWLISPYHSETVVWGATTLFLAMTFFVLAGMLFFLMYSESLSICMLLLVYICYLCAMFTFEAFVPFPFLLLTLWFITQHEKTGQLKFKRFLSSVFIPMVTCVLFYFVANKLRIGSWVGHYGEASHLNTDIYLIIPNLSKYLLKLLYAPLYFTFNTRDNIYLFIENKTSVLIACVLYMLIMLFVLIKFLSRPSKLRVPFGLLVMFGFALTPVINLYFMYYKDIEQDRYVYFASAFFYPALMIALYAGVRNWAIIPLLFCVFVSAKFLIRNNQCWHESGKLATSLMNDFRWQNAKRIFVLLNPDSYRGAYCMRSMPNSTLAEMLYVQRGGIDIDHKIVEVYQWNANSPTDSATCRIIDSTTLEIKLISEGGWLWRNSFGAVDVETESLKTTLDKWYPWFTVTFKNKQPGDVFIYAVNNHWVEVKNF